MIDSSELVGYLVWLISVTSDIPKRFGEFNAKAFNRIQIGTCPVCYNLPVVLYYPGNGWHYMLASFVQINDVKWLLKH